MVDVYRDYRFRSGQLSTNPYPDWSGLTGATGDFIGGVNQNTTTPGASVTAWASTFGLSNLFAPTPSQSPSYDPGGVASTGVNGWPSVNYIAANADYLGGSSPPYDGAYFLGAGSSPWCLSVTCRVVSAPLSGAPAAGLAAIVALEAYRMALKVYQKAGDSLFYAFLQTFSGVFSFGAEALVGAALPNANVFTFGWNGTQNFLAVDNGSPVFATAGNIDNRATPYYNGIDFTAAPVFANARISRQAMKSDSTFPTAYVAGEVSRVSSPP